MRLRSLTLALLASALLVGCAGTGVGERVPPGTQADDFRIDLSRGDTQAKTFGEYLSARFAASEHDLADAARYFRGSLANDPTNADLQTLAFFYSASAGEMDDAARIADQIVKKGANDDRAQRLALAVVATKAGNYEEARKDLGTTDKGAFANLTIGILGAWLDAGAGDNAAVSKDLKMLSSDPNADALTAFHIALIDEFLDRKDDADAAYRNALLKVGSSPRIVDAYGRFLERTGRATEATALYTKLGSDTAFAPILEAAKARVANGHKPEPLVRSAQDGAAEALFGIAGSLTDASSADISILYLRFALFLRPDLDLASILLGDRFETLQKFDDAIAVYRNIDHDSPYYSLAAVQVAIDEARMNKTDAAIADLKKITADSPNDAAAWTALGDAYRAAEHWPEAAAAYDHAANVMGPVEAKDWPLFYARAIAEDRSHRWDVAETDLKKALALSPEEPQVLNYLGYSWVDQGRNIPAALAMLQKARQLRPFDGYIVDSVGWAYFRLGRYDDAAKTLLDAILLVPGDPTINDHLGDALWRVGKKLDARFQWSHALAFGPDPDEKSSLEKKLKDGLADGDKPT